METTMLEQKIHKWSHRNIARTLVCAMLLWAMILGNLWTPAQAHASTLPKTKSHAYTIINGQNGERIAGKKEDNRIYPASTAKMMTALVVLEHSDVDDEITFTKKMSKKVPGGASRIYLTPGRTYTVESYLTMLLLKSDADSAEALAYGVAGGPKKFVRWMNLKAKSLGMNHTSYDNPIGMDVGNGFKKTYATAADYGILAYQAMHNPTIRKIVARHKARITSVDGASSFICVSTNGFYGSYKKLLKKADYKIIGTKTGTTNAAGHCLVATAVDSEGREVIVCFYGNDGSERMYKDIKKLFDYAYRVLDASEA